MNDLWASFKINADAEAYIRTLSPDEMIELVREIDAKFSGDKNTINGEQRAKIDAIHDVIMDSARTDVLRFLMSSVTVSEKNFRILVDDCHFENPTEFDDRLKKIDEPEKLAGPLSIESIVDGMEL